MHFAANLTILPCLTEHYAARSIGNWIWKLATLSHWHHLFPFARPSKTLPAAKASYPASRQESTWSVFHCARDWHHSSLGLQSAAGQSPHLCEERSNWRKSIAHCHKSFGNIYIFFNRAELSNTLASMIIPDPVKAVWSDAHMVDGTKSLNSIIRRYGWSTVKRCR